MSTVDPNQRVVDPLEGTTLSLFVVSIVGGVVSLTVVGLRTVIRLQEENFRVDDGLMLGGLIIYLPDVALACVGALSGLGTRNANLNETMMVQAIKYLMLWMLLHVTALCLVKTSICMAMLRIATTMPKLRIAVYSLLGLTIATFVTTFIGILLLCRPVAANWDPSIIAEGRGECSPTTSMLGLSYTSTASTIVTDLACAILPAILLWHTQMRALEEDHGRYDPFFRLFVSRFFPRLVVPAFPLQLNDAPWLTPIILMIKVLQSQPSFALRTSITITVPWMIFLVCPEPSSLALTSINPTHPLIYLGFLVRIGNIPLWSNVETAIGLIAGSAPALRRLFLNHQSPRATTRGTDGGSHGLPPGSGSVGLVTIGGSVVTSSKNKDRKGLKSNFGEAEQGNWTRLDEDTGSDKESTVPIRGIRRNMTFEVETSTLHDHEHGP